MVANRRGFAVGLYTAGILAMILAMPCTATGSSPHGRPPPLIPDAPAASFNFTPGVPVVNQVITFDASDSYSPNATIIAYGWDFGDGTGSSGVIVTHIYPLPGSYPVILSVTDDQGFSNWTRRAVGVVSTLAASISADRTGGVVPNAIAFNASVSGGIPPYSHRWDFGDGGISQEASPSHLYTSPGTYTVALQARDTLGQWANATLQVSAEAPPLQLAITANATWGVSPMMASFAAQVSGGMPPYSFAWSFGDGGTSPEAAPPHTFAKPGNYTVAVVVADSAGNQQTASLTIVALPPLLGIASPGTATGPVPFRVSFRGLASGGSPPYTFSWDFGDGGKAIGQNATHTFLSPGGYTVVLTVRDAAGRSTTDGVQVTANGAKVLGPSPPIPARALYLLGAIGAVGLAAGVVGWHRKRTRLSPPPPPPDRPMVPPP